MFEKSRKYGILKLKTSYTSTTSNAQLKPYGILSFIRNDHLTEKEYGELQK